MNTQDVLDPKSWAERTFGSVQLQDMRRTRRAVQAATNLAENPLGSLPAQMHTWKETKAVYRLRDEPDVTFAASVWVHVGDPRADMFPFFQACQATQTHFLVRAAQNRRVEVCEDEISYALTQARAFPSQASRPFEVPARHGRQARSTQLQLACGQMTLLPPRHEPRASKKPLTVWVVRVWEEQAPDPKARSRWNGSC